MYLDECGGAHEDGQLPDLLLSPDMPQLRPCKCVERRVDQLGIVCALDLVAPLLGRHMNRQRPGCFGAELGAKALHRIFLAKGRAKTVQRILGVKEGQLGTVGEIALRSTFAAEERCDH